MSAEQDLAQLDGCHCCEQTDAQSAFGEALFNAPGQPALRYRIGSYGSFLQEMIRRLPLLIVPPPDAAGALAATPPPPHRPLAALTSRQPGEPVLALLDAWASVLDVLTFYQERITNEGYLRTATERRSVLELARAVGYELSPGLAASVDLAFTVESALGSPGQATIEVGTKVMSVPGQNEQPQVFETVEVVDVRVEWNELKVADPVLTPTPETLDAGKSEAFLQGTSLQLTAGDRLLFMGEKDSTAAAEWETTVVTDVTIDVASNATHVFWDAPLQRSRARCYVFRHKAALFGHNAPDWRALSATTREAYGDVRPVVPPLNGAAPPAAHEPVDADPPASIYRPKDPALHLDTVYSKVAPHSADAPSFLLLLDQDQKQRALHTVAKAVAVTKADFAIASRVHALEVHAAPADNFASFKLRTSSAHLRSEPLSLGQRPLAAAIDPQFPLQSAQSDDEKAIVPLSAPVPSLAPGRRVIVLGRRMRVRALRREQNTSQPRFEAGEAFILLGRVRPFTTADGNLRYRWLLQRPTGAQLEYLTTAPDSTTSPDFVKVISAADDPLVGEAAVLEAATPSLLTLTRAPRLEYDRASVSIFANIVRGTHGETVANEVLGNGGSVPNLAFALKHKPLTYVATSANASGAASTLGLRVNEVLWHEVPSLFGVGPREHAYALRIDDGGQATVIFGDGTSGARPPTGVENIVASYRAGLGPAGNVKPNALSLLLTRPIGVRTVTNPLPATDGVAPADLERARAATPLNVRASGRVVSLLDAEDTARTFAGVGNAQAVLLVTGAGRVVHVTIAAPNGDPIADDSPLFEALRHAIEAAADPSLAAVVDTYEAIPFELGVDILVDPDFDRVRVLADASVALSAAFGVTERPFGGRITEAQVLRVVHELPGVVAARLTELHRSGDAALLQTSLSALPASVSAGRITRAQALVLALGSPKLGSMLP